jgi:hypothetical protein
VDLTWGRRSALGPLLRAGYVYANSGDDSATGGGAQFVLNTGTFDGCVRIPVGDRFQALPCIHVEGGALSSTGIGVTPSLSDTRPWASLGPLGAVRYRLISVVFAELLAGLRLPLVRDRFYFDSNPNTTVFRPPALAFLGGASLGVTIP